MPFKKGNKIGILGKPRFTVDEKQAKKLMNQMIAAKTGPLVRAALGKALGERFVYKRIETSEKTFKHVRLIDPAEIAEALNFLEDGSEDPEGNYIYITTKEPDMDAIDKLLSRPFGKAKESIEMEGQIDFVHSLRELSLLALKRKKEAEEVKVIDVPVVKEIGPAL